MSRLTMISAAAVLGLGAGGCAFNDHAVDHAGANPTLNSFHQPVVQRTDFVIDVAAGHNGLAPTDLARLDGWFEALELGYGDRIAVDEPTGYDYPEARRDIARIAAEHGLLLSQGAPVTNGQIGPGTLRVVARRATATVPDCPTWSDPEIITSPRTSSNFGCAVNSNLAAMVANPNDLVLGQAGSVESSASTATRAIRSYREAQPTGREGLPATSTDD